MRKPIRLVAFLFVVVAVVGYGLTGVVQVRPGERAVVRRFGQVLANKPEPGLWIGLPWGMDRVDRIAVDRVQNVVVGYTPEESGNNVMPPGQLLTGDHNLVNVQATVYYKVRPEQVESYVAQADRVDALVGRAVETVMAEWVAGHTVDDALLNGKTEMGPDLVKRTQERIGDYDLGVQVLEARVTLIAAPDEVKSAFDNVARAQTAIRTLLNRAEQERETALRTAQAEKFRKEQDTAAYALNRTTLAHRDAERFLERLKQYKEGKKQNPDYLRQIWQEERGKLFANLKENKRIGLLDHHLGANGLDITIAPPLPKKSD
jgi:modulator of FtsH protease HflK